MTNPTPKKKWFRFEAKASQSETDIFLHDQIGGPFGITSASFVEEFRALPPANKLNLHINSMGGDVFDGLAIYNLMIGEKNKGTRVHVIVDGIAASIASVIAMAGDEILMPESAFIMVHDPSGMVWGKAEEMERMAETMRGIKDSLVRIYAKRTGLDRKEVIDLMAEETWMDGPTALGKGFATILTDVKSDLAACADSPFVALFAKVPPQVRALAAANAAPSDQEDSNMPNPATPDLTDETTPDTGRDDAVKAAIARHIQSPDTKPIHAQGEKPSAWQSGTDSEDQDPAEESPAVAQLREQTLTKRIKAAYNRALDAGAKMGMSDIAQQLLNDNVDPDQIPMCLIEIQAANKVRETAKHRAVPSNSGARVIFDWEDPELFREQVSDAIAYNALKALNPQHKLPDNGARKYMNWGAVDVMRECVRRTNVRQDPRNLNVARITDEALGNTTSDFPNILGVSANKVFRGAYEAAPRTYMAIAAMQNLPNFQQATVIRPGDFPAIRPLNEHGEIQRGSMSESAETVQLKSHGRTFGVTRQVLVNDNLGAFTNMAVMAGRAVAVYENTYFWTAVIANPTLVTTNAAVFSTTHANLTGSGTAISSTSLGVGRAAMRVQKSLDGHTLNIAPAVLAVPAAKETIAESVLSPLVIPEAPSNLTPAGLRSPNLQLVVEPLLDGASVTAWYLFGNPALGSNFVYGYLNGLEAPRVRTNSPFNVDGVEFQVLIDFYVGAIDYRFGYKNVGA